MLMVLKPGKEPMAEAIFKKWELDFAVIGEVTDTGHMVLEFDGEVVCDIPLGPLADDAPLYDRPHLSLDDYKAWAKVKPLGEVPESEDLAADLVKLMACPDLASRRWIWEQYDSQVGADTLQKSGGDAAVVRVHGSEKALAMSTDCTPRYVYVDPYEGGKQAVAETWRNLCAVGATPLAITNCLNFANPQRPEIMAQIVEALRGMGDACRALDYPIVSGNVSLYNESKATGGGSAILPTPAIGGVGLMLDHATMATIAFKAADESIFVVGEAGGHLGQSLWLREILGREDGPPPPVNLEAERRNGEFVRQLITDGLVTAVHDISDGGLAVAVAEMALAGNVGAQLGGFWELGKGAAELFGEGQGRYVVTVPREHADKLWDLGTACGVELTFIGWTGGDTIGECGEPAGRDWIWSVPLAQLRAANEAFFKDWMD
jgi:phosphoribosylformylglycinamidine synthase